MACGNVLTVYLDSAIICDTKLIVVPLVWIDCVKIFVMKSNVDAVGTQYHVNTTHCRSVVETIPS